MGSLKRVRVMGILAVALLLATTLAGLFISTSPTDAALVKDKDFFGLWQGVEPFDGGRITTSIFDHEGDGVLELRSNDTFIRACQDPGLGFKRRGIYTGTGVVNGGRLVAVIEIFCLDDTTFAPIKINELVWSYERIGDVLKKTGDPFIPPNFVIFHRISD